MRPSIEFGLSSIFSPDSRAQTVRVFGQKSSTLNSLPGATDFIRGVSPGYGNAPQDLEFTNTYGGTTLYIMRGSGNISSSKDDNAVVNDKLYAHGLENLRIIDASIMPNITSGNTNAPTIMIAEKGADFILNNQIK